MKTKTYLIGDPAVREKVNRKAVTARDCEHCAHYKDRGLYMYCGNPQVYKIEDCKDTITRKYFKRKGKA